MQVTRGAFWRVHVEGYKVRLGPAVMLGGEPELARHLRGAPPSDVCSAFTPHGRCGEPAYRTGGTAGYRFSLCDKHFWQEQSEELRPSKWLGKRPRLHKRGKRRP